MRRACRSFVDGDENAHTAPTASLKSDIHQEVHTETTNPHDRHTETTNPHDRHATLRWWSFAPALVVVIPLLGFSLQEDDRRRIYTAAHQFGTNPLKAILHAYRTIDGFLDKGNFRPVGRALENIERIFVFASAEATSMRLI